jgi:hypothetical protein
MCGADGVLEEDIGGAGINCTRQTDPGLLTAGQVDAAFADLRGHEKAGQRLDCPPTSV